MFDLSPFLWMGVIDEDFQARGHTPSDNEILKIVHKGFARLSAQFFMKRFGIPSGPPILLVSYMQDSYSFVFVT